MDDGRQAPVVDSADVNAYLRDVAGDDFTAKDFRTWAGTVLAAIHLRALAEAGRALGKKGVGRGRGALVAGRLGNTPAICRKCYIHPAVIDAFMEGRAGPDIEAGGPLEV